MPQAVLTRFNELTRPVWVFVLLFFVSPARAQVSSNYSMRLFTAGMQQISEYRVADARGFGLGGELARQLDDHWSINAQVAYDHQILDQDSVLDEWDWDYWEDTYIEWLPGGEYDIINRTLEYTSGDSIYRARFEPHQTLGELRLSLGADYESRESERWTTFVGLRTGISVYDRGLKMEEHWTKSYALAPDTTASDTFPGFAYDYSYTLTHFAPAKQGIRPFFAPRFGLRRSLSASTDVEFGWQVVVYFAHADWYEHLFNMGHREYVDHPLKAKHQIWISVRFKY